MTYPHGAFCWHEIGSPDPAKAKDFYAGVFGYNVVDSPIPGAEGTYTMLLAGDGQIAGMFEMTGDVFEGVPPHWISYVWVDDVEATVAKAKTLGAQVAVEPMDMPEIGQMAVIHDPTGAGIALFHGTGHPGAAQLGVVHGSVDWNELVTTDAAAAKAFYGELFGWASRDQDMGEFIYTTFLIGDHPAAGMVQMAGDGFEGVPSHWMPYVSVDDCDECAEKTAAHGGQVTVPPRDIEGVGRFAMAQDSTGAHFSFIRFEMPEPLAQ